MNITSTLESWLDTATKGFFPETQERIRGEYQAAYQDALDAGETDILRHWGDPRRVNRELRHTYLTVQETELFQPVFPQRQSQQDVLRAFLRKRAGLSRHLTTLAALLLLLTAAAWQAALTAEYPWGLAAMSAYLFLAASITQQFTNKALRTFKVGKSG